MKNIQKLSILFVFLFHLNAVASGCDSNHFYSGEMKDQRASVDFGEIKLNEVHNLIQMFKRKFQNGLLYRSTPPVIVEPAKIKIVKSTYRYIDTDCGWSYSGSELTITQLYIKNGDLFVLYPDIFNDISAEDVLNVGDFITISN